VCVVCVRRMFVSHLFVVVGRSVCVYVHVCVEEWSVVTLALPLPLTSVCCCTNNTTGKTAVVYDHMTDSGIQTALGVVCVLWCRNVIVC
jgi:hypothetical protein